jgi:hypothetical protein
MQKIYTSKRKFEVGRELSLQSNKEHWQLEREEAKTSCDSDVIVIVTEVNFSHITHL